MNGIQLPSTCEQLLEQLPTGHSLVELREAVQYLNTTLRQLSLEARLPAQRLVVWRAKLIDIVLIRAWHAESLGTQDCALVAVGGYGRGELHPHSDIDLLLLCPQDHAPEIRTAALSRFITLLWDLGLKLGHSVRTVEQCIEAAHEDVTVLTNLIESRLLAGDAQLLTALNRAIEPCSDMWPSDAFFHAKVDEQQRRYLKYDETAYNLEPNIKEGPGGLRDIQTIGWVAKRHFTAADSLGDLVPHGFLNEEELTALRHHRNFLWEVRMFLHLHTGRSEERLLFDHQLPLARHFGYREVNPNRAIEQFMQRYYRTIMELSQLNEMLLQLFEEVILANRLPPSRPLNRRFRLRGHYIETIDERVFIRCPFAMLELFLLLQQHPDIRGLAASTVRLIRKQRHMIDDRFRRDLRARSFFMEILRQPNGVTRQLRRMNQYGILGAYLPEFDHIIGRMQYDLFHVFTVDQHTLFVLRNLRRFHLLRFQAEFPHCSEVMQRVAKPELLYIAALYHDIAKGRNGDHSKLGAVDAERFCRRHGLGQADTDLVSWLVIHHLSMSMTAQKRDIHDPQVIEDFARLVGTQERLDHLYLLTVADIRATNRELWNEWRASLLRNLYAYTHKAFLRGLDQPINRAERIAEVCTEARNALRNIGIADRRISLAWAYFSDDYFLRHDSDEIVWHTRAVMKKANDGRTLVLARPDSLRGGTEIFVYTRNRPSVFAVTASVLEQLGLNVLDARLITNPHGYTLDSYTILEDDGQPIHERARMKEILLSLRSRLNSQDTTLQHPSLLMPRLLKHFRLPTRVTFSDDIANGRTIVEIITSDRPGLLSHIAQSFMVCQVQVLNAKIATIGARAEDVFFLTDNGGKPLREARQFAELRRTLIRHLDGEAKQTP